MASYRCSNCGFQAPKWMGFCPQCRNQEPLTEEVGAKVSSTRPAETVRLAKVSASDVVRLPSSIGEVDRVLGGGFVPGSVVLLGGEPGVGKSTLLLHVSGGLAEQGSRVLIASAEESAEQVGMRAQRLGIDEDDVHLVADDDVDRVIAATDELKPDLLVVDSIQTVGVAEVSGAPGGVAQVRETAARVIRYAKSAGVATVIVGHVTKDGGIAGPKLVEHMVDVVLYLEGDPDRGLRALRSLKNRFGGTHLVGLFEMRQEGLLEVDDPSGAFLTGRQPDVSGTVVFPAVEGRRSLLVEVQALVADTANPQPRRSVRGIDPARVHLVLAVLQRHCGVALADQEVYVNVVGGLRLTEPGADLAVAVAIASSVSDRPAGAIAAWGEVGLSGEVRAVAHDAVRREEALRHGLESVLAARKGASMKLVDSLGSIGLLPSRGRRSDP